VNQRTGVAVVSSPFVDVLLDTDAVRITRDPVACVVRLTRTSKGHDSVADFDASTDAIVRALAPVDRPAHVLLLDPRLAPMRGGDDFDVAAQRFGRDVCGGFARVAVLVATQVGRLQVGRFQKDHGGPHPFFDEDEAVRYLMAK
jgi:hypothetical protein